MRQENEGPKVLDFEDIPPVLYIEHKASQTKNSKPILIVSPLTLTDNENSFMLVLLTNKSFHSFRLVLC